MLLHVLNIETTMYSIHHVWAHVLTLVRILSALVLTSLLYECWLWRSEFFFKFVWRVDCDDWQVDRVSSWLYGCELTFWNFSKCDELIVTSYRHLASAWHYAYDVIEMCAPLHWQRHLWSYGSRTWTLTLTLELTLTLKIKENKNEGVGTHEH